MTKVLFLHEKDGEGVFAYFPELVSHDDIFTCYAHVGQHSACSKEYAAECKEAITNEYLPLLSELIQIGYKDLKILNKQKIECWRKPTPGEIKFGEGATHYRDFTMSEIGLNRKGNIKSWFVADDGLRYNRY